MRVGKQSGLASLTQLSPSPSMTVVDKAVDFMLTAYGMNFTEDSVVGWNGADRPTTFASQGELHASISTGDVNNIGTIPVSFYNPSPAPGGTEISPRLFYVLKTVDRLYLPLVNAGG